MLAKKIFITGIYGSGKTTLAKLLARLYPTHTFIKFDSVFDYTNAELPSALDKVYNIIKEHDSLIMDALPLIYTSIHGERLERFLNCEDACIIIVQCSKEGWLNNRLPLKKEISKDVVRLAELEYLHFYDETVPYLFEKYENIILTYDSEKGTLQ